MKFRTRLTVAVLILCLVLPLGLTSAEGEDTGWPVTASIEVQDTRVTWEIVTDGKTGETAENAIVRFTLANPGDRTVTFDYTVASGSADREKHLMGDLSGSVTLSVGATTQEVTIAVAPLADNPGNYGTANNPNARWSGERIFYLYCSGIKNALFDGDRRSLTVPVPIESDFDYAASYSAAVGTALIDLNIVSDMTDGVYPITVDAPLTLTGFIDGDIRKMLDAGVFTHILLPDGYLSNDTGEEQTVTYTVASFADEGATAVRGEISTYITVPTEESSSLYSEGFGQLQSLDALSLGLGKEANGIVRRLDLTFTSDADGLSLHFVDEDNIYRSEQVYFSDETAPRVTDVSAMLGTDYYYGDQVPVVITFSEPVYTDGITFQAGGESLRPMESSGTISESVSFLYTLGDEALGTSYLPVAVTAIIGAEDLSGRGLAEPGAGDAAIAIAAFDATAALLYAAKPEATVDQGTAPTATVKVSVPLKADTELRTWLAESSRLDGTVSTALKARAVTAVNEGGIAATDVALTVAIDETTGQATGLTGTFTAPENTTGENVIYILEFYLDDNADDSFELLYGLTAQYAIPPLILVDDESDVALTYTDWPSSNSISASAASGLSLGYTLNVAATWQQKEYFIWGSRNDAVATIDENGNITVLGVGTVSFSLTVTNPISSNTVTLSTPTLKVTEADGAYLYVPTALSKLEVLKGSDAKVSIATNITARNEAVTAGAGTDYTFTLYSAVYSGDTLQRGAQVWQDLQNASAATPIVSYTVPSEHLQTATAKGVYGYILEIKSTDTASGITLTAEADIRVREKPAKAVLIRPSSLYLTDESSSFSVTASPENTTNEAEYQLTVTRNSEVTPVVMAATPGTISVSVSSVNTGRLMDVYTVSLQVKNPDDATWSVDSYCVYVYRSGTMNFWVGGFPTGGLRVELKPDLVDGEIYSTGVLRSRTGLNLSKRVSINSSTYAWSNVADQITWSISGSSASIWYGNTQITEGDSLTLPPSAILRLQGDAAGTSTVTATHARTGMSVSQQVVVSGTDSLYLFQTTPQLPFRMVYTNGNGQEKTLTTLGSVGVYEESSIASDVVFYPLDTYQELYDFAVLKKNMLEAGQTKAASFDLYPIHTVTLPKINYNVSLSLFNDTTGDAYTDPVTVRGGLYVNGEYYSGTRINGSLGNADQTVTADSYGRYALSFDLMGYSRRITPSDELKYVIEVSFGALSEADYFPTYITVENADIQARKSSPLGVSVSAGITKLNDSLVQNKAIILSQSLTLDGQELSLDDGLLKLEEVPSQALLNMTLMLPGYNENMLYYLHLADGSGASLGYAERGVVEQSHPFSDIFILRFSNDISGSLSNMIHWKLKPGEKGYVYPSVTAMYSNDSRSIYQLSKPIRVQRLHGIPKMDYRIMDNAQLWDLFSSILPGSTGDSISIGNSLVKEALEMTNSITAHPFYRFLGLELSSTDDPLVYKGVLRQSASSKFNWNNAPTGVLMNTDDPATYGFLPNVRGKGVGRSEFMKIARSSGDSSRYYSGGAYIECSLKFNVTTQKWDLSLLRGDLYLGASKEYERRYNGYISVVPVTAKFRTNMSVASGLTILRSADGSKTAYIPRISPTFSIYGSGGVGRDYKVLALWAGPYGKGTLSQTYLWYLDSDGQTENGQRLGISGEVGVAFEIKLGPLYTVKGDYELTNYSNSWTFNNYNDINRLISGGTLPSGRLFSMSQPELVPVSQTISYDGRSYLDSFQRSWGTPSSVLRLMSASHESKMETLQSNAYPYAAPLLAEDGSLLAYLSDMGSTDLRDTAVVFSVRDTNGEYPEGEEIDESDYPDSDLALSGTASGGASAVWLRYFIAPDGKAGEEATSEDVVSALASTEVMASIYNPASGTFLTTQLTTNDTPELSPVTASANGKAIAAWLGVTLGDLESPLEFSSNYLMYALYDGSSWGEAQVLYDGSLAQVTALSTAMMADGTTAILYQVMEDEGDSELFCTVLKADGTVRSTLRLTENATEDYNPQITAVEFPNGVLRFVAGWNHIDESEQLSIQLAAVNADGTLYPTLSLSLSEDSVVRDYDSFLFSKGAKTLEELSILWCEAEDDTYAYAIYGAKPVQISEGVFSLSGRTRLLKLPAGTILGSLDARTDLVTGEVHLVMVLADTKTGEATMSVATVAYQSTISVAEPQFLYADVIPGLELPVSFTVTNDGMDTITGITVSVGDDDFLYADLSILPGDSETFTVLYPVPDTVVGTAYAVTALFGSEDKTGTAGGFLNLSLPDVDIGQIAITKQSGRERGFLIQLETSGYAALNSAVHSVRLEVWDNTNFTGDPLWAGLFSGADAITALNDGLLPVNVTLEETALASLLDEDGEIPDGGTWVYFRVVLLENGNAVDDAESGNDLDYVQIYSLIERYGQRVSLSSTLETVDGATTLRVNAANNAMQSLSNGNIVATLRDEGGNALETLQTYNGTEGSLLSIDGEESSDTATLSFSTAGHSVDLTFTSMSAGNARLSSLKLTGVQLDFDPEVYEYIVKTYDLTATTLTAVAEDSAAIVTVKRNGSAVSTAGPLSLPYGETVFTVTVTSSGGTQTTYTVRVQNISIQSTSDSDGGSESGSQSTGLNAGEISAVLKIGGISRTDISIRISGGQAIVSLGDLAREIFEGNADATLTLPELSGVDRYLVALPAEALVGTTSGTSLTIDTPIAQISIPSGMLEGMVGLEGKTAGIAIGKVDGAALHDEARVAVGGRPVLSLTLTLDGVETDWSNPDTPVAVSIPYLPTARELESPESIVIWYIDGNGSLSCVTNGRYDLKAKAVTFQTTHFSLYAVGYSLVAYADVASTAWYADAVSYLASRRITSGTTATTFSPDSTLTRGQFITLLLRAYGIEADADSSNNFADAGNTYYTGYLATAKRLGISRGVGDNKFAPEAAITRQETFTLLYNVLKVLNRLPKGDSDKLISDFTDSSVVADYAQEAMTYLVKSGIIVGNNGYLLPEADYTRAQMAQVLYNLLTE